ncbi:hypothetical protein ACE3G8_04090 [Vreelandella venusta]
MSVTLIHINISGPVQSGKSSTLASIKQLLESNGYLVGVLDRAERNNPSEPIASAARHEKPRQDSTVFVLTEKDA